MSTPETIIRSGEPFRPITRAEYPELGELGLFEDERVEPRFGLVIPLSSTKQTFSRGESIAMLAFPDVTLAVDDILPPSP